MIRYSLLKKEIRFSTYQTQLTKITQIKIIYTGNLNVTKFFFSYIEMLMIILVTAYQRMGSLVGFFWLALFTFVLVLIFVYNFILGKHFYFEKIRMSRHKRSDVIDLYCVTFRKLNIAWKKIKNLSEMLGSTCWLSYLALFTFVQPLGFYAHSSRQMVQTKSN